MGVEVVRLKKREEEVEVSLGLSVSKATKRTSPIFSCNVNLL